MSNPGPYGPPDPASQQPAWSYPPTASYQPVGEPPQQPPAPPRPGRTGVILLAVLSVLLLGAAGALGALYVNEQRAHDRVVEQLTANEKALSESNDELQSTKTRLDEAEQARDTAEAKSAEQARCVDSAKEFVDAVLADDEAKGTEAATGLVVNCG